MIKNIFTLVILLTIVTVRGQENKIVDWIDNNAISIADATQSQELGFSVSKLPEKFKNAKIYGFGEASHQHAEFSNIKAKFFKYLVTQKNVKALFIEESFGGAFYANQYVKTGEGNPEEIVKQFKQGYLQTIETIELIKWIHEYNSERLIENKIEIFGIDCMFNYNVASILVSLFEKNNLNLSEEELSILEMYSKEIFQPYEIENIEQKISKIETVQNRVNETSYFADKTNIIIGLEALKNYLTFMNNPTQKVRDEKMANIVSLGLNNNIGFVTAHNFHIQKTKLPGTINIPSLGNFLDEKFGEDYYAIGFDFGVGNVRGYTKDKTWKDDELKSPLKNTFAEVLFNSKMDIFFFDFDKANADESMQSFLEKKRFYLGIGGYGVLLEQIKYSLVKAKLAELYDGLIFVKEVSFNTPIK